MERIRSPFQGILNIFRFNWHFFAIAFAVLLFTFLLGPFMEEPYRRLSHIVLFMVSGQIVLSLLVSLYVYDISGLYRLKWLDTFVSIQNGKIVNIHAGFDETSALLKNKFPDCALEVFDFYDATKHTEVSIKRARKTYAAFPNTKSMNTSKVLFRDNEVDVVFLILSAHEIRSNAERNVFFTELKRVLKKTGKIIVTEHLRDGANFLAYNIGFFHFIPKKLWYKTFKHAKLTVLAEKKITPFITTFILQKHDTSS